MAAFDLDAYLARIGVRSRRSSDRSQRIDAIAELMRAHMAAIPFENLDVLLGRGVRVDLESVAAKLVTASRALWRCYYAGWVITPITLRRERVDTYAERRHSKATIEAAQAHARRYVCVGVRRNPGA